MRILIHTVGSRGDVQPCVALARELVQRGHNVAICTSHEFRDFIESHNVAYAYLNNDLIDLLRSDEGRIAMEGGSNVWQIWRSMRRMRPLLADLFTRQVDDAWRATQEFDPEMIVFHPKAIGAKDFAQKLDRRVALAFYLPMFVPTSSVAAVGFPRLGLGSWYNRSTYRLVAGATMMAGREAVLSWRQKQGLSQRRPRFLKLPEGRPVPVLHGYSETLLPKPEDWPAHAHVTGFWFLDGRLDWQPPEDLQTFLSAGEEPLYVGFGSISGRFPETTARVVLEAISQCGIRAVVSRGWGGLDLRQLDVPESVFVMDEAPHEWLFSKVSAVVHHGGCGTTAAGLRAGRPTLICPLFGDQPFWGRLVHERGLGARPLPLKRLTVKALSQSLKQLLEDVALRHRAAEIGAQIRAENGVRAASELIEQYSAS